MIAIARSLTSRNERIDAETENLIVANGLRASDGHHGHSSPRGDGGDNLIVAETLSAGGHPNSNMPGRHHEDDVNLIVADPISAHEGKNNFRLHNVVEDVQAFDWQQAGDERYRPVRAGDYTGALSETRVDAINYSAGVRRLTPLECERLQGWADDWTRYTADGREINDANRYRMIGNGVVAPVAEWLGHRLVAVNEFLDEEAA